MPKEDVKTLNNDALLRQSFLSAHKNAVLDHVKQIEVPEDVFRSVIPDGTNVMYENVRVFIEGTMDDTLKHENLSGEERLFGHSKVK